MRFAISLLLPALAWASAQPYFRVAAESPGAWPQILECMGLLPGPAAASARVIVVRADALASQEWAARVEGGAVVVLEGESSLAEMFGFRRTKENVRVRSVRDIHDPALSIIWERAMEMPRFAVPAGASVFARERWEGAPLLAGFRRGAGAVLWVAAPPGERGYERLPFIPQALRDLGVELPFRSGRLWAFFDYSYRLRVDVDYFAERWRRAGISGLHVAAWHFFEPDGSRDAYLARLIEACHQRGIQVYAWLELPHVSDRFWREHPEWREKTALGQDAQLDWRKLMNLQDRDCFRAVSAGVRAMIGRFDWDGVNLAELYFESLEGMANPARFTPMNETVRAQFRAAHGYDPAQALGATATAEIRRTWLDFRAGLVRRMQQEWIEEMEAARRERPYLDVVLTHVDDRFDPGMRDAIGADAGAVLPLLDRYSFTFLVEDPATVWHLGPRRYGEIARRYSAISPRRERLAVDVNVAERYQDVYPTKQQTGTELFQLVHTAAASFSRVALYAESSLRNADVALLPAAAAAVSRCEVMGGKVIVESPVGVGVSWTGSALVDGRRWPVAGDGVVWLPAGAHTVEPGPAVPALGVLQVTADLKSAGYGPGGRVEFAYTSQARVYARLDRRPGRVEIDGQPAAALLAGATTLILPRGQHLVTIVPQ